MKTLLRVLAVALTAVVVLVLATFSWLWLRKPAQRPASSETIERTPERLARGAYLVEHVTDCFGCHSQREWTRYAGPLQPETKGAGGFCLEEKHGFPGQVCVRNITPDPETGIGGWSDGEVLRALREGVDRKGHVLFPLMPYTEYRHMSDEDAAAIVAYLRTVPAVKREVPRARLDFPVNLFIKFAPQPLAGPVPEPRRDDPVAYGGYLARIAGCRFCHSPVDDKGQPLPGRELSGGQEFAGPWGTVRSANLTPDPSGIGAMKREEFIGLIQSFAEPAAWAAVAADRNTPMPWIAYSGMSDEDLAAIYDYLRSVPPVANMVEKRPRPEAAPAATP